jgi:hypothetical protein
MTAQEWNKAGAIDFDYLKGRVMKVNLTNDTLYTRLYDRDNGPGAARIALAPLLEARAA